LHAGVEEVAGVGSLAVVSLFAVASIQREIGWWGVMNSIVASEQPYAGTGKAKQVEAGIV